MKPNEFSVVRARCNRYFAKDKQWFNQGNEYFFVYYQTKSGKRRKKISMADGYILIAISDRAFDAHFEIVKTAINYN